MVVGQIRQMKELQGETLSRKSWRRRWRCTSDALGCALNEMVKPSRREPMAKQLLLAVPQLVHLETTTAE